MDTEKTKAIDWERIELDYRAGLKTLRKIADEHGISHGAINKRAKRDGWSRDLSAKIQQRAEDLVSRAMVAREVSKESRAAEREIVEANARDVAAIHLTHRQDIRKARTIAMRLMEEMDLACGPENAALLEELGELLRSPDQHGNDKLNDLYQKLMSLPGRAKTMKDLSESLRVLVTLERQAFGLDDQQKDRTPESEMPASALDAKIAALVEKLGV